MSTKKIRPIIKYVLKIILLAIVYHLAARVGLKMAYVQANTSPVWPPTGIGIAALLLFGLRLWPGVAAGVFLGFILNGGPPLLAIGMALGNTLESLVGAYVLQRFTKFHNSMDRVQDVGWFAVTAFFSTMISASIGSLTLLLLGKAEWPYFGNIWTTWWIGDLLGALVVAPALLVWLSPARELPNKRFYIEGFSLLIPLSIVSWYVFSYKFPAGVLHQALLYVIFPFMIIAALRFKQRGATIFIGVASGIAITGTINFLGPFSMGSINESLVLLQTFTGVLALTSLVLAATTMERQRAVNALSQRVIDLATLNDSIQKIDRQFSHWKHIPNNM